VTNETRVKPADGTLIIEKFINKELKLTPMSNHGAYFASCYSVDPLLLLAINYHESHYCQDYPSFINDSRHNCGGIMNGGQANGLKTYATYGEFINNHCQLLNRYLNSGKDSIEEISGTYAPIASSSMNRSWTGAVRTKYLNLWHDFEIFKSKW
jgi:hypothetical protein